MGKSGAGRACKAGWGVVSDARNEEVVGVRKLKPSLPDIICDFIYQEVPPPPISLEGDIAGLHKQ